MNTFKKLILATLILSAGTQAIHANPFSPKAIAAVTLAGLGLGTAGAVKYYGFNTVATAVLEKCANAKNWFSNKISDYVFGSYKKQIASMRAAQTQYLEQMADEQAILKQEIKAVLIEKDAQLAAKEADRKDAHERAINLTKKIMAQNKTLIELKEEKERVENTMRGTINGLNSRSAIHETDKKSALAEVERLTAVITEKEQTIAELQVTLTQMQSLLAEKNPNSSDERTSESDQASQDSAE